MKKTFVRVLLTFIVSGTLIVIPATSAQAFDAGRLLKETVKKAPTVGKGVSLFGRFSNPYGWAITAAQVGWFAWGQRDAFIATDQPERTLNEYGELDPNFTATPAAADGGGSDARMTITTVSITGPAANMTATFPDGWDGHAYDYTIGFYTGVQNIDRIVPAGASDRVDCRNNETGAVVRRNYEGAGYASNRYHQDIDSWNHPPPNQPFTVTFCGVGETVVGFQILPRLLNAPHSGQEFTTGYGTLFDAAVDAPVMLDEYAVAVECVNYSTLEVASITATTPAGEGGFVLPSCGGRLGEDWHAKGFVVTPTKPEIDNQPIPAEIPVPDFLPLEWDELLPADPDWQPCQSSKNGCSLSVWIDTKRCYEGVAGCADWEEIERAEPERIKCRWGVNDVALSNCRVLRDLYKPLTEVEVDTGLKTEPGTGADTSPGTSPGVPVGALPRPENEAEGAECMPTGWAAFNPIEWVLKPVKCALTWAFVPDPAKWGWAGLVAQMETRPPASIVVGIASAASAMAAAYQGSGDCGILADFRSSDMPNAAITCAQVKSFPGFGGLYALVQAGLFALTGLGLWKMFSGVLEDGQ